MIEKEFLDYQPLKHLSFFVFLWMFTKKIFVATRDRTGATEEWAGR
jgi:hypothetical protein